ncbi:MAG: D-glycero-alpha-D-manno-heptose-1,7-bisphosphate 7-phosphatase [Terriglobales bacterium]
MAAKAVFLDRDGVINQKAPEDGYITTWAEMRFLPGVTEAISLLNQAGFFVIVVSNQRCVAKGLISPHTLELLHDQMREELVRRGAKIDAIYYCPHEIIPECKCRKPSPGLLLRAANEHSLDLTTSWMIGDSEIDIEAGSRAGCRTAFIGDNRLGLKADLTAPSLLEATERIVL